MRNLLLMLLVVNNQTPNILGLAFGVTQMILYLIYRKGRNQIMPVIDPKKEVNGIDMSAGIADQPRENTDRLQQMEENVELDCT